MHILEIPSFFTPCGGEFCLEQAKALMSQGHEVRILSNVQLGATVTPRAYLTLPFRRYAYEREGLTVWQSYQRGLPKAVRWNVGRWVRIVCQMFDDYLRQYGRPDVIHAHCAKWAGYAAMRIAEVHGIPYVITEHLSLAALEREFGPAPSGAWQIPLLRKAYEGAAWVLPVAEELVEATACYYGRDYRWQWVSNVIDTARLTYRQRKPRTNGRPFVFCCLAIYDWRKGYDVLAEAWRRLAEGRRDLRLLIAGAGTDSHACRELFAGLRGVKLCGGLDRQGVERLLYASDALVLPSRSEVQPLAVMEAMSSGIPVVTTECVPQCLRLKGCQIVPIDDAEALSQGMRRLTEEPADGRWLSEEIRRMASPEVVGRRLSELFAQL